MLKAAENLGECIKAIKKNQDYDKLLEEPELTPAVVLGLSEKARVAQFTEISN